jgi:FkbM family methyltransferase
MNRADMNVNNRLVFDIGLHVGDDAAYYLHLGHRVLGVEANPLLATGCEERFRAEIRAGRMNVLNVGISKEQGEFTFYRNLTDHGWSSFESRRGKKGGKWEELRVQCLTVANLIEEYGCPLFMKVDIEGADLEALLTLSRKTAPRYVSLELNTRDPIVETLVELGYTSFKFVNGETFRRSMPIWDHEVIWRMLRKIGRNVPTFHSALTRLPERLRSKTEFDPPGPYSPDGYSFSQYSSGPFGENAAGPWLSSDSAIRWFNKLKGNYISSKQEDSLWWDVHAKHSS